VLFPSNLRKTYPFLFSYLPGYIEPTVTVSDGKVVLMYVIPDEKDIPDTPRQKFIKKNILENFNKEITRVHPDEIITPVPVYVEKQNFNVTKFFIDRNPEFSWDYNNFVIIDHGSMCLMYSD